MSEENMRELDAKLAVKKRAARDAIGPIGKAGKNIKQGYAYAKAEDYIEAVNEACSKHGLDLSFDVEETGRREFQRVYESGQSTRWGEVYVRCVATLRDCETGHYTTATSAAEGQDPGDKATSKANTQARKLAIQNLFNMTATDDLEADERVDNSYEPPPTPAPRTHPEEAKQLATPALLASIEKLVTSTKTDRAKFAMHYGISSYERLADEMTVEVAKKALMDLSAKSAKQNKKEQSNAA